MQTAHPTFNMIIKPGAFTRLNLALERRKHLNFKFKDLNITASSLKNYNKNEILQFVKDFLLASIIEKHEKTILENKDRTLFPYSLGDFAVEFSSVPNIFLFAMVHSQAYYEKPKNFEGLSFAPLREDNYLSFSNFFEFSLFYITRNLDLLFSPISRYFFSQQLRINSLLDIIRVYRFDVKNNKVLLDYKYDNDLFKISISLGGLD